MKKLFLMMLCLPMLLGCALAEEGGTLVFTPAADAEPRSNLTLSDFAGDWTFAYLEHLGEYQESDKMGLEITFHIAENGSCMTVTIGDKADTYNMTCEMEEDEAAASVLHCKLQNGRLKGANMRLMMLGDDDLVWYVQDIEKNMLYYRFVPVAE